MSLVEFSYSFFTRKRVSKIHTETVINAIYFGMCVAYINTYIIMINIALINGYQPLISGNFQTVWRRSHRLTKNYAVFQYARLILQIKPHRKISELTERQTLQKLSSHCHFIIKMLNFWALPEYWNLLLRL